ncbi:hypothetical protein L207DRAFT_525084 [Hyaloscypha variabilis F]|uniref:Protein kinase domain-containing protein n=1 Tax=Hyaloscypha variabilis (strain UAMH 11265 / GT02V1 / F) TaxID=1149755 RepID=A0A2J6S4T8_HYAVF|nr:hypothetical protein L207DRAFT_525084 [Hyaloscypha variabilis F]
MEPTPDIYDLVMYPTAAFKPTIQPEIIDSEIPWSESYLNPKNRIETLDPLPNARWRIDGGEADGTRFFTVPCFALGRPPLRIDTYIPLPQNIPNTLRNVLSPFSAMLVGDHNISRLAISQHILRALDHWSRSVPDFEENYFSMPFGSKIVIDFLCADVTKMEAHLVPIYDVELKWLTLSALETLWNLPHDVWPEIIDFEAIKLQLQLHEAISLVKIAGKGEKLFVFKSGVHDLKFLYHELRLLLTMAPNRHVIPLVAVVTKACRFGGKVGVCGFILGYHAHGTLRDVLSHRRGANEPSLKEKLRWARQITSDLIHIQGTPAGFYSDMKLNNILLAEYENELTPLFVDFEQRGGWYSWSPPEVYYLEYFEYLAASDIDPSIKENSIAMLRSYLPSWRSRFKQIQYQDWNDPHGFSNGWLCLTDQEREAGQVFMLGKLLWCLFEGVASVNCLVTVETFREDVWEQAFPEFRRTPEPLRALIRKCTVGAMEWKGQLPAVVRRGNKLYPRGRTGRNGEPEGTAVETQEAARQYWREELRRAERFIEERKLNVMVEGESSFLGFMKERPSFKEVLAVLEDFDASVV